MGSMIRGLAARAIEMAKREVELTIMSKADIADVLRLFYEEGWLAFDAFDLEYFIDASPMTCFKMVHEGKTIGAVFAVVMPNQVAYPNSLLLAKEYRSKVKIFAPLMSFSRYIDSLAKLSVVYAAERIADSYRSAAGYQPLEDYARYTIAATDLGAPDGRVVAIGPGNIHGVRAFNQRVYGDSRSHLLAHYLALPTTKGYACLGEDGAVTGYAVTRKLVKGEGIGPLLASSDAVADSLLTAICADHAGKELLVEGRVATMDRLLAMTGASYERAKGRSIKMAKGDLSLLEDVAKIYAVFSFSMT